MYEERFLFTSAPVTFDSFRNVLSKLELTIKVEKIQVVELDVLYELYISLSVINFQSSTCKKQLI